MSKKYKFLETVEQGSCCWSSQDFTFSGNTVTGISETGLLKIVENTELTIPRRTLNGETIEKISDGAFKDIGLTSVDFSKCTKLNEIGENAFRRNKISNIVGMNRTKLKGVPSSAFLGNLIAEDFVNSCLPIPETLIWEYSDFICYRGTTIFSGPDTIKGFSARGLKKLQFNRDLVLPKLTWGEIYPYAFSGKGLTSVDFSKCPDLHHIGKNAFAGNEITQLDFPEVAGLQSMGSGSFKGNKIEELDLSGCGRLKKLGKYSFANNKLTSIKFPGELGKIGYGAFSGNSMKKEDLVDVPFFVEVPDNAFKEKHFFWNFS